MERFAEYSKNNPVEEDGGENEGGVNLQDMHFTYEKFRNSIKNIILKIENEESKKFKLDKLLEL